MNAGAHDIARGGALRVEVVLGQPFANDVAVGHHADQLVVLSNGDGSDVMLKHQLREFSHRRIWTDPIDAFVHHFFDFHGGPPFLKSSRPPGKKTAERAELIQHSPRKSRPLFRSSGRVVLATIAALVVLLAKHEWRTT